MVTLRTPGVLVGMLVRPFRRLRAPHCLLRVPAFPRTLLGSLPPFLGRPVGIWLGSFGLIGLRKTPRACDPGVPGCYGLPRSRDDLHLVLDVFLPCWSVLSTKIVSPRTPCARFDLRNHALLAGIGSYVGAPSVYTFPPARLAWPSKGAPYTDEVTARRGSVEHCDSVEDVISLRVLHNSCVARRCIPVISPTLPLALRFDRVLGL